MSRTSAPRRLVGRDRELARFVEWVTDVVAGRGRAVLVEGEPGIGKSALVRAGCATARDLGCHVFWGAGDELGQALPLLPLLDALRVRESPTDGRRTTIARLLRGELSAGKGVDLSAAAAEQLLVLVDELSAAGPTVLVVDDLQWADQATVAMWGRLMRSVRQIPLLLVGVTRPVPRRDSLVALRAAVDPDDRLRLGRLPDEAVTELVATLAGGQPARELLELAAGAAGNPLYLTELVEALARADALAVSEDGTAEVTGGPRPPSLSEAIADRLGFLPGWVQEVLRAAALLGVDFSASDLTIVSGRGIAELLPALDEARAAGVLAESGQGLAFRHPLIRSSLYEQMPGAVRAAWHRDAGRALAAAGAPVDRVARQLLPAVCRPQSDTAGREDGVDEWVVQWLLDAAPLLIGHAPEVAVDLLRRAWTDPSGGAGQHELLACRLADALYRVGDPAEAEQVALRALEEVADADLLVDLHWTLAQCRAIAGRSADTLAALRTAPAGHDLGPKHRARLLVLSARTHRDLGEVDTARAVAADALRAGTEIDDQFTIGWALHVLTLVAMMRGEVAAALPLFERGLAVARDPALTDLRLLLMMNKAVTLGDLDRYEEALAVGREVRQLADRTGNLVRAAQVQSALGQLLLHSGGWDDALAEVDALSADVKDPIVTCCDHGIAAVIHFHRGDGAAARRHLAAAAPYAARIEHRVMVWPYALALSLDLEQSGAPGKALAALAAGLASGAEVEELLVDAVRLAVETDNPELASTAAAAVEALMNGTEIPHRRAAGLCCRGLLERDPALLMRAAEEYRDAGRPLDRAQALEAAAVAFAIGGDASSAQVGYTAAVDVYLTLNAAWDVSRLQAQFRAFGIRRGPHIKHRQARQGWDSLTPTEAKIAAMVVEGMSNPKIAAQLFLSPRTVATHVSHILTKLEVHSRIDIAREAGRRPGAASGPTTQAG